MKYSPALQVVEQVLRQLGEDFDPAKLAYFDDMPGDSSGAMADFLRHKRNYTTEAVKQKRETVEQTPQNIPHLEAILALLEALHELCLAIEKQKFIDAAANLVRLVPENKRERVIEIICSPVTGTELESQLLEVVSTWKSGVREALKEVVKTKTHVIAPTISDLKNDIITKAQKEPEIGRSYGIYMGR
jgi:hypothetical protein